MRRMESLALVEPVCLWLGLLMLTSVILGAHTGAHVASADGPMPPHVKAFIETYLPLAQAQYEMYKVPISVALAQAGIETAWGASETMLSHNNFFALTSDTNSPRATGMYEIWIERAGKYYSYTEYASAKDAWLDFGYFLTHDPNYRFALPDLDQPRKYYAEVYCMYTKGLQEGCDTSTPLQIWDQWTSRYDKLTTAPEAPPVDEPTAPELPPVDEPTVPEPMPVDEPTSPIDALLKWLERLITDVRQRIEDVTRQIKEWWKEHITELDRRLEEWWQRQIEELDQRLEEWWQRQIEAFKKWLERELERELEELCTGTTALVLCTALISVFHRRQRF